MDIYDIPPMKPVLVEHVSDDINVLQRDDVTKQKTTLTARAIEDIFKCAPIRNTNATDVNYFVDNKVDLDKIVTACSRTITDDQYIHGPELKFDHVEGDQQWSANHSFDVKVAHAFIYVFSVLDDSTLTWAHYDYDEGISIDDGQDATDPSYRAVDARAKSPKIRQIFIPNVPNEYFNITGRSRQDLGSAWTRYGKLNEDGVTYTWEPWFKMGKTHNGAEYATQIITADGVEIANPLYDAVYHVYGTVPKFTLPNANLDGYIPGMKISVEVHPPKSGSAVSPSCRVLYTDTDKVGENAQTPMNVYITPKIRRNTKDIFGNVKDDVQVTSIATFEIVEIDEGSGKFRTWELDSGVEETDFIGGIVQMLGEHTDLATGDLVKYQSEEAKSLKVIDILHPITTSGYAVARFLKREGAKASNAWKATVEILNPMSEADFTRVADTSVTPDPLLIYYIRTGTTMALAENGHPAAFTAGFDYYSLNATCSKTPVIQFVPEGETVIKTDLSLNDLTVDEWRGFSAFANRNCVLHIRVVSALDGSPDSVASFQGKVYPTVYFYPDPHDSYIQKGSVNPSAFTWIQLEKLARDGGIIVNETGIDSGTGTHHEGLGNAPASTRALLEAYGYIASKLQHKGLFLGNRAELKVGATDFDRMVTPGSYFVTPKYPGAAGEAGCTYPPGLMDSGCNLFVVGNGHAPVGAIHEEEGGIVDPGRLIQIAIIMEAPLCVYARIGVKGSDNVWTWTTWQSLFEIEKPLYYHSRWDYFESPDKVLNHLDDTNVLIEHNAESKHLEIVASIPEEDIVSLMEPSDNPAYDPNVNYDIPQFMVGIDQLTPDTWASQKLVTETGIDYVIKVRLPAATASELKTEDATRRRKIRFLFYGKPVTPWNQILFRLSFASATEGNPDYTYERNWGGKNLSIIVLEFEQMDLPSGERVWCPHEIG